MSLNGKTVLFFAGPLYEDLELWYSARNRASSVTTA
jgi:hypothetical protein